MSTIEELTNERDALRIQNTALTEQAKQLIGDLAKARGASGNTGGKRSIRRAEYDRLSPREQASLGQQAAKGEVQIVD